MCHMHRIMHLTVRFIAKLCECQIQPCIQRFLVAFMDRCPSFHPIALGLLLGDLIGLDRHHLIPAIQSSRICDYSIPRTPLLHPAYRFMSIASMLCETPAVLEEPS
jgi:hypothetical protein